MSVQFVYVEDSQSLWLTICEVFQICRLFLIFTLLIRNLNNSRTLQKYYFSSVLLLFRFLIKRVKIGNNRHIWNTWVKSLPCCGYSRLCVRSFSSCRFTVILVLYAQEIDWIVTNFAPAHCPASHSQLGFHQISRHLAGKLLSYYMWKDWVALP